MGSLTTMRKLQEKEGEKREICIVRGGGLDTMLYRVAACSNEEAAGIGEQRENRNSDF